MNDEDLILINLCEDRLRQCDDNGMLTNTRFLDIRQQSLLFSRFHKDKRCRTILYGGYEQAERQMLFFVPDYLEIKTAEELHLFFSENEELCPFSAVRLTKDRFSGDLSHRDYLGALMALGIKRETLGDIVLHGDMCDLIAENKMIPYICDEMTSVGRASVKVHNIRLSEITLAKQKILREFHTVPSLRLDAVVSQVFRLSRSKAVEAINKGLLYVNGLQTLKCDCKLNEGDKIVLRGKGKIVIAELQGESQKGRIRLQIDIYR